MRVSPVRTDWHYPALHRAIVLSATVVYVIVFLRAGVPWLWTGVWVTGLAVTAWAPVRPALGLGALLAAVYATPRYADLFTNLAGSGLLGIGTASVAAGAIFWRRAERRPFHVHAVIVTAAVFFAWLAIISVIPRPDLPPARFSLRHDPRFLVHAAVLLVVASQVLLNQTSIRHLVLPLCAGLIGRSIWQGPEGLYLEGDAGPLALMLFPLALAVFRFDVHRAFRVSGLAAAPCLLVVAALTYNRATAVAFAVAAAAMLWQYRRNWRALVACAALAAAGGVWMSSGVHRARFAEARAELLGQGLGSVTERLALWGVGFEIVRDHPFFGVGLGRYAAMLADYRPELEGMAAHNSFVQIGAETGIPGLLLYVALFGSALLARVSASRRRNQASWQQGTGLALEVALVAYLSAGLFISRHDMLLAYVLVGASAALTTSSADQRVARQSSAPSTVSQY